MQNNPPRHLKHHSPILHALRCLTPQHIPAINLCNFPFPSLTSSLNLSAIKSRSTSAASKAYGSPLSVTSSRILSRYRCASLNRRSSAVSSSLPELASPSSSLRYARASSSSPDSDAPEEIDSSRTVLGLFFDSCGG